MKVVIVGGGPAGMMAGITSAKQGDEVIILEKMSSLGRKLLITGKGRCNITNNTDISNFIKNTPGNGKFLYSVFNNFTNVDIVNFLERNGVKTKVERGERIFPVSDEAKDILDILLKELKRLKVMIKTNTTVEKILIDEKAQKIIGVQIKNNVINADKVIIATGGKSYSLTGSTGDGYVMAEKIGHSITKIMPSLIPLECYERQFCIDTQGLSLKNVKIILSDLEKNKKIYEDFGEMLFTHFGISGPIVLSSSAYLVRYKSIDEKLKNKKIKFTIDLKPALSKEKLDARILRDFEEFKNRELKNSLNKLLPQKLINGIIQRSGIDAYKKVNEITKDERKKLVDVIKKLELTIEKFRPIEEAIITSGGINTKEINPTTMESKIIKGLYFAGEIIDVDALTGGFNLQIAWSTGYTAGLN